MSWINLEQLVVPVVLTSFMVALSLLVPAAAGSRGLTPPPLVWSPTAGSDTPPQAAPLVHRARRPGSAVGSRAGSAAILAAGPTSGPVGGPLAGTMAVGAVGRRGVAEAEVTPGAVRRGTAAPGVLAAVPVALAAAVPTPTPGSEVPRLRAPVPGRLLRGFDAPASPYGPGHRGVDLAAGRGTQVTAPAPGRVRFAGQVGGTGWVSIEIAPGVTVSVGPIRRLRVRAGDDVGVLSVLGQAAPGHGGAVHLGLRVRGEYVDPQPYLARFGPARLVPLEPPGRGPEQLPRRAPRTGTGSGPDPVPDGPAKRRRGTRASGRQRRRRVDALGQATSRSSGARTAPSSGMRRTVAKYERPRGR